MQTAPFPVSSPDVIGAAPVTALAPTKATWQSKALGLMPSKATTLGILTRIEESAQSLIPAPTMAVAGGIAGALIWKQHRMLGLVTGLAIGGNAGALFSKETRGLAIRNLAVELAAVGGALLLESHPVIGFVGGAAVGGIAAPRIPGVAPWLK